MSSDTMEPFVRDLSRMLTTFFAVAAIDVVVLSSITGQLRVWFPVWLDPEWASRTDPWVTYSQSYFSGIVFIPLLARAIDRDFLVGRGPWVRAPFWGLSLGIVGFILWWKGGLMAEHHKEWETVGWLALSAIIYGVIVFSQWLPDRLGSLSRREVLRRLLLAISVFFITMAIVDPVMQIAVQQMQWSTGLLIEIGFFIPAGFGLGILGRRLGRSRPEHS